MILLSPRAGQEAEDFGDVFMNFTMATACTEPAREMYADDLEVGVELEVETDLADGSFTMVLPTEPEQVVVQDLVVPYVEVESCLETPDQRLYTLPLQETSCEVVTTMASQIAFPGTTLPLDAMPIEVVTSLPEQILGTLPLEPTHIELATSLVPQTANLETMLEPTTSIEGTTSLASQMTSLENMTIEVPVTRDGHVDEALARAAIEAIQTGNITSVVKEELRCSIQMKRLQDGKDELEIEPDRKKSKREVSHWKVPSSAPIRVVLTQLRILAPIYHTGGLGY